MSKDTRVSHPLYGLLPTDIEGFGALAELALDMRSSWNHATDEVWRQLDPELWQLTQNPWTVVQAASRDRIEHLLGDPSFRKKVDGLVETRRSSAREPAWFQKTHAESSLSCVAYFSMEFMLSEALPIYSGGLGNVAGDQLKAASDLGVPIIGVGLLYQQGYFRQLIGQEGRQQALYPYNDPGQLPVTPLRKANGEWLRLQLNLPGHSIWLRAWQVQVGRVKLYLLDSNDVANFPPYRGITSELYGGGSDLRLMQELVLGIGGWHLLDALGIEPEVCHLNEGHAALAVLERARTFMRAAGQTFEVALASTRAGNLFTTHTAVDAGFDRFAPGQIEHWLGHYARDQLGIALHELLALGRLNPNDSLEPFNMAYLAMRGSGAVNGVSQLHGDVSRRLFGQLFPRWPTGEVPIGQITNGIHTPTWDSAPADQLWTEACGKDRWSGPMETLGQGIREVPDARLWSFRTAASAGLIHYAREHFSRQLAASGASADMVEQAKYLCDSNALTLGFARRFATYKRPNLLLRDPDRLLRLLTDPKRPVQLILAGKAHPADKAGQALIQEWVQFIQRPQARPRVIFLNDYNMHVAEHLVQGVDVWLNTPRRPWEACGTSGMKVLVNGGLNLSVLDGWWAEAYSPELGWALGGDERLDDSWSQDARDAEALFALLEQEVAPEFYDRDERGIPKAWIARMRESMAVLTAHYSANRSVREYTERYYLPAASSYRTRTAGRGERGAQLVAWRQELEHKWASVHFGETRVETTADHHVWEVQVYLDELDPAAVQVELYANGLGGAAGERVVLKPLQALVGAVNGFTFGARVRANRPAADYTPRLVPYHADAAVPLEEGRILWQQ